MSKFTLMPTIDWCDLNAMFRTKYGRDLNITAIFPECGNDCYEVLSADYLEDNEDNNELIQLWDLIHEHTSYDSILVYVSF